MDHDIHLMSLCDTMVYNLVSLPLQAVTDNDNDNDNTFIEHKYRLQMRIYI